MYIDSNEDDYPDGDLPVAELLRDSLEYLLKVLNLKHAPNDYHNPIPNRVLGG